MNDQKQLWEKIHSTGQFRESGSDFVLEVLNTLKPESKILELGAGQGYDANRLATAGHKVIATDISETAIFKAQERFEGSKNLTFEVKDLQEIDYEAPRARIPWLLSHFKRLHRLPRTLYSVQSSPSG